MTDSAETTAGIDPLDAAMARNATLLHEVDHRVKNNLQLIASLLVLQCRREEDPGVRDALNDIIGRVNAVAVVHRRLFQGNPLLFDVADFLRDLIDDRAADDRVEVTATLERVEAPASVAAPLALAINELLTNALKHAYPDGTQGTVHMNLARDDGRMRIEITDRGVGVPATFVDGFGLTIVRLLCRQLKAEFEMRAVQPGVTAVFSLPLEQRS